MASLVTEISASKMFATFERLGHLGVTARGLKRFQKESLREQLRIARLIETGREPLSWRSIQTLGIYQSGEDYLWGLQRANAGRFLIGTLTQKILLSIPCLSQEKPAMFVAMTVVDLGLKKGVRYDEICKRGQELGYLLCPAEAAPVLALADRTLSPGDAFYIAMNLIDSFGFVVGKNATEECLELGVFSCPSLDVDTDGFHEKDEFVFMESA